jgi:hypothetical protein
VLMEHDHARAGRVHIQWPSHLVSSILSISEGLEKVIREGVNES